MTSTTHTEYSAMSLPEADKINGKAFVNLVGLYNNVRACQEDCLIFRGISVEDFAKIESWRDRSGRRFRLFYIFDLSLLIITIPVEPHERLHGEIYTELITIIIAMGLRDAWAFDGATTRKSGRSSGEGDSTGQPSAPGGKAREWSTLVIEAGMTQPWPSLRTKMRWWFSKSSGQVKVVLLSKLEKDNARIVIEKWIQGPKVTRPGATSTRSFTASQLEPLLRQTITITKTASSTNLSPQFTVTGAPLVLEFGLMFLRPATGTEADLVVERQRLEAYAKSVWETLN